MYSIEFKLEMICTRSYKSIGKYLGKYILNYKLQHMPTYEESRGILGVRGVRRFSFLLFVLLKYLDIFNSKNQLIYIVYDLSN